MKLQHLGVIFAIIIIPISITLSTYIQSQIDAIVLQKSYDSSLYDATYDTVKAFQINTVNNKFSTISDSKIRDIEAAVNVFYNSLGASLGASGYDKNTLKNYTPALLFNLYDGFYIYSKYDNQGTAKVDSSGNYDDATTDYGIKPFIYYSARYKDETNTDFVVNYTLDNYITIMGRIKGKYETRSGYLIDTSKCLPDDDTMTDGKLINCSYFDYNGVKIDENGEELKEYLVVLKTDGTIDKALSKEYSYLTYNSQKIYFDGTNYYWYNDYQLSEVKDVSILSTISNTSTSAFEYYKSAYEFSMWVNNKIGDITVENLVDSNGSSIGNYQITNEEGEQEPFFGSYCQTLAYQIDSNASIFKTNDSSYQNDPMLSESNFNEHRKAIIRKTIEDNLKIAIGNFSVAGAQAYEFALPVLSEIDWDKIVNNISILTLLQGIPTRYKFYNNYAVVTNNKNQEVVDNSSIYLVDETNHKYHKPGCTELIETGTTGKLVGYNKIDFLRQTAKQTENSTAYYFYPKGTGSGTLAQPTGVSGTAAQGNAITACYNCIVNAKATYSVDDIIRGEIERVNDDGTTDVLYSKNGTGVDNEHFKDVRTAYLTALARCRYDLYKISGYFEAEN